jgi:eukaryotic-like serine/threonine-protein kinase
MPTFKERLQWFFRMALLLFILASVAFLSALTAMRFAIQGREVVMPNVVGQKVSDAQENLFKSRLGLIVEDRVYSSLAVDAVVRQSPAGGVRVKTGEYAHVILSLGPQKVTIPKVEDASLRAAKIELLRSGLQLGEVASLYLPDGPPDMVLRQDPASGSTNVASPHVDLLVSLGPRPAAYVMPPLGGLTLGEAEGKLNTGGLRITKLTTEPSSTVAHGIVVGQLPVPGSRVEPDAPVELQVTE